MKKYMRGLMVILLLAVLLQDGRSAVASIQATPAYYLYPPNLHLISGETSAVPLVVRDQGGNPVAGSVVFSGFNTGLISISASGFVTALRPEGASEIGTWVQATINGTPVESKTVVRVLLAHYTAPFSFVTRPNTALYYPTSLGGEDLSALVNLYQIPDVDEYAYQVQYQLMNVHIFNGARQIFEVDFGETEQTRVCGISGNPIRLGWNVTVGSTWQNCFLVPFISPRSPQWFVMHHELAHNFTWQSQTFGEGLGIMVYSEGIASILAVTEFVTILQNPTQYPLGTDATASLNQQLSMYGGSFTTNYQTWLSQGANFSQLTPDIVDGMWLQYKDQRPADFARRFFKPLRPEYYPRLASIVNNLGTNDEHTIFAALVSAALKQNLAADFTGTYHYPLNATLFNVAYAAFSEIVDPTCQLYLPVTLR